MTPCRQNTIQSSSSQVVSGAVAGRPVPPLAGAEPRASISSGRKVRNPVAGAKDDPTINGSTSPIAAALSPVSQNPSEGDNYSEAEAGQADAPASQGRFTSPNAIDHSGHL